FPVDNIAQTAAIASCRAVSYYAETSRKVVEQRESFTDFLKKNGWFVIDSRTNFVFTKKQGLAGEEIYQYVKKNGILIRHFSTPGIEDFVRITIGTPEQMNALKEIMSHL
ncbi:MAG: aminotransferase class I/II-fold pyridoxal phosphate-dependent enzyme, partial [Treponema sp.]|nr:aminotransferase class I/II-fold pyridoxal phosphate-dependent enzyme [Treponema sp.]